MSAAIDNRDPIRMHPAAELFPLLDDEQIKPLCESLSGQGFDRSKPILRWRGLVLDGRNRLRACAITGVQPVFADLPDHSDPYVEAWKHNGLRRDLTPIQRAAIQAKITTLSAEWQTEQEERRRKANESRAEKAKAQHAVSQPWAGEKKVGPPSPDGKPSARSATAQALADRAGVSRPTMERALKLQRENPEKLEAVIRGDKPERKKPPPRVDHERRESAVRDLHQQGLTAKTIAHKLSLHPTQVSDIRVKLGLSTKAGSGRTWADVDHVSSTLEGVGVRIEQLAEQLEGGAELLAEKQEIDRCIKSLSRSIRTVRRLRDALKRRPR